VSLLRRRRDEPAVEERSAIRLPSWVFSDPMLPTFAGPWVGPESAMYNDGVAACVRTLKQSIGMMSVDVVRKVGDARLPVENPPRVVTDPSGIHRQHSFVAQTVHARALHGNAYWQVVDVGPGARPLQLESLPSSKCRWMDSSTLTVEGEVRDLWPLGDVVHIPNSAFLPDGCREALSPVVLAKEAIASGLAAQKFGSLFFGRGGQPSGVLSTDQTLSKEQADDLRDRFESLHRERGTAVLSQGLSYNQVQVSPDDSQFLELQRFVVEQVCRFLGVPPSMVYLAISGQNMTYANISQADTQYLKHSLQPLMRDIEAAWSSLIDGPMHVRFNPSTLLRMDDMARHQLHALRLRSKTTTVNTVKALEDEAPFGDEFDAPGVPGASSDMAPAPQEGA